MALASFFAFKNEWSIGNQIPEPMLCRQNSCENARDGLFRDGAIAARICSFLLPQYSEGFSLILQSLFRLLCFAAVPYCLVNGYGNIDGGKYDDEGQ